MCISGTPTVLLDGVWEVTIGIMAAMSVSLPSLRWRALRSRTTFEARVVLPLPGMPETLIRMRWEGRALERSAIERFWSYSFQVGGFVWYMGGGGLVCRTYFLWYPRDH